MLKRVTKTKKLCNNEAKFTKLYKNIAGKAKFRKNKTKATKIKFVKII